MSSLEEKLSFPPTPSPPPHPQTAHAGSSHTCQFCLPTGLTFRSGEPLGTVPFSSPPTPPMKEEGKATRKNQRRPWRNGHGSLPELRFCRWIGNALDLEQTWPVFTPQGDSGGAFFDQGGRRLFLASVAPAPAGLCCHLVAQVASLPPRRDQPGDGASVPA